ncbi:MAG: hypothetical protein JWM11_7395 [Planctomycetaceae bacterium]|nr:hypothetical protein [Planctomycetaceae bacterium]
MTAFRLILTALLLLAIELRCLTGPNVISAEEVSASKDTQSVQSTEPQERGAVSPELAFQSYQTAVEKGDWKTAFLYQTEASRDYMVGGLLAACHLGVVGEPGKKLATESADAAKLKVLVTKALQVAGAEQSKLAQEMASLVTDQPKFMSHAIALFKEQKKENWLAGIGTAKLIRLQIKEDRATALMEIRLEKGAGREPMSFLRRDGRWYVNYSDD